MEVNLAQMNHTQLFWIDGPWLGRLALAARPRGGDWLQDEIEGWRNAGVSTILSLLTPEEEESLELADEAEVAKAHKITFISFPVEDRRVPVSPTELSKALERIEADLQSGKDVVIHCRQGVGRSGLAGTCLLINAGVSAPSAIDLITRSRGVHVPETQEQRDWIDFYAASLAGAR